MSATLAEAATPDPATHVPPQVQRCGGVTCPPGTCDHHDEVQRHADGPGPAAVPPTVLGVLGTAGTPLGTAIRTSMEGRFGHDFGRVRIHTDADAARSAADIHALAYTFGPHVVMGAGRYQPHTPAGQRLLAHELTHVVQQGSPVSAPTSVSDPHDPAEQAAERVAEVQSERSATEAEVRSPAPVAMVARQTMTATGGPGRDPCLDLLEQIIALLEEAAQRINDALNDPHRLFEFHRGIKDAHPEYGSWEGHERRFNTVQEDLRYKLAEWDADDRCRGFGLSRQQQEDLAEAREYADKDKKTYPARPAPSMREAQEPAPSLRERVAQSLRQVGVPAWAVAGLVVLIIAALADPEPFTKVAGLIGAAAAVAFFILIGRRDEVPGGPTVASAELATADQGESTPLQAT